MAQITIADTTPRVQYTVGSTPTKGPYTIPFVYFEDADIKVYFDSVLKTLTTDYTISGTAVDDGFSGGTVLTQANQNSITITIERDIAIARTTDFPTSGIFNIATLNTVLDKLFAISQWLETKSLRTVQRAPTSTETYSLEWPSGATTTPGIIVASSDAGIEISSLNPADLTTATAAAASSATASASSATAAASSATASASSASTSSTKASEASSSADASAASAATASAAAAGIYWKEPVVNRSTANLTLSGEQTIDGILTSTSRILVMNQSAAAENGIYVTASGAWARAVPLNTWDEHVGAVVLVSQGTAYSDQAFMCTVDPGGTLGSTAITWAAFGAVAVNFSVDSFETSTDYTAGTTTTLVITTDAGSEENIRVSFDGVVQHHSTYTYTSGTRTITFDTAIPIGTAEVECQYGSSVGIGTPSDGTVSEAKIADNAVTLAKMASGTDGNIISFDASGNPVAIATGTDGQVLTSAGAGAQPAFETLPTATDITGAFFQAVPSANVSLPNSTYTKVTFNTEIYDPEGEYDHATNHRYQPVAGTYLISAKITLVSATDGHRWITTIHKNGTNQNTNYTINANASDENTMYVSQIVTANGSDYYEIFVWQGSGSTRAVYGSGATTHSYFQGHRIA